MIELQGSTLATVKVHLLGRDETGAPNEPPDHYASSHHSTSFEREFQNILAHQWTLDDLKLKREDCSVESEEVRYHDFPRLDDNHWHQVVPRETADLCPQCIDKRETDRSAKYEKSLAEQEGKPQPAATNPLTGKWSQLLAELEKTKADAERIAKAGAPVEAKP